MHRLRSTLLPVLLILLAMVLAACGDNDDTSAAGNATSSARETAAPEKQPQPEARTAATQGPETKEGEACPIDVYPDSPGAESYIVPGSSVPPERSVTEHTLVSTKEPNASFKVSDEFVYVGSLNTLQLAGARPMPIAVSKDQAETFVFVDHEGGLITRALVFTFVQAKNRECLTPDTLDWVTDSLDSGVFRTRSTSMAYATAAFTQPFEAAVADFLNDHGFVTSGCYLVKILTRLYSRENLGYIFYIENTGREAGMDCPAWRVAPDKLTPQQQQFIAAFSANMADNLLIED